MQGKVLKRCEKACKRITIHFAHWNLILCRHLVVWETGSIQDKNGISAWLQVWDNDPLLGKSRKQGETVKHSGKNPIMLVMNGHFSWFAAEWQGAVEPETWPAAGSTNPQGPVTKMSFQQMRYCTQIHSSAHRKWNRTINNRWYRKKESHVCSCISAVCLQALSLQSFTVSQHRRASPFYSSVRSASCPWNSCLAVTKASFRTAVFVLCSMAINHQHKTCIQPPTTCTAGIKTSWHRARRPPQWLHLVTDENNCALVFGYNTTKKTLRRFGSR